ncbi:YdeI/OmpD-associated family protein [Flavicella sediminum]|uniref:YdeI/OmpD-associated family protein n=1 Tax=Flavicella sediminum TaxID=2585141 RepID=UPI00111E398A|nr:YdeI/OmpD-associated family protein [Flavicella sediminum]
MTKKEIETFCPISRTAWRKWLAKNHQSKQSIWLVYYKSSTKKPTLSWSDAVDEALCYGWIDSTKKTIDAESYMQYFSKRKPNSTWSKINKDKVKLLIAEGLMTDAGSKSIEIAKTNGSWTILDEVEALKIPEDLQVEFEKYKEANDYFKGLSKSSKKILLYWIVSAKRKETRKKRIVEIALNASRKLMPKQFQ